MTPCASLTVAEREEIIAGAIAVLPGADDPGFVLTCEHASWRVPPQWHNLGLSPELLQGHIGWDIGAAEVTEYLSEALKAPAFLAGYSRLFVECNRMSVAPDFVSAQSGGVVVPGNQGSTTEEIACRKVLAYDPFHNALCAFLDRLTDRQIKPAIVSVHSFTPQLGDQIRPWHAGVLWKRDGGVPRAFYRELQRRHDGLIGLNQPYDPHKVETMTLDYHALPRGLPHVVVEIRNDLIGGRKDALYWSKLIADSLNALEIAN